MGLRKVEQGLSSFFDLFFGIFDDFSKWSTPKALSNNNNIEGHDNIVTTILGTLVCKHANTNNLLQTIVCKQ